MKSNFKVVDLAQNLKNKTARNVRHLAIEVSYHERLQVLAKVCKYKSLILTLCKVNCYAGIGRTIVFASTKVDANSLMLSSDITHELEVMHGDIAQN